MNAIPAEIQLALKKLGLSGMLSSLIERNREAVANQMNYLEFLSLLLQDELLVREQRRYQRRYKSANFAGLKTIEAFDFSFNPKINQALVRDLASGRFVQEKYPVLIIGPCGTGKSHLAQALGTAVLQQGMEVFYTNPTQLSELLQQAKATQSYTKTLRKLANIPLLILDDFGLKPLRTPQDEDLHDLVAARYERTATLITSNLALEEWPQAFPNQLLGIATIDRVRHNAYYLILDGKSYRSLQKKRGKD